MILATRLHIYICSPQGNPIPGIDSGMSLNILLRSVDVMSLQQLGLEN